MRIIYTNSVFSQTVLQVVGVQRRKVIETRNEQCEKVTVQKDYGNSNINAIKCLSTGVCRSILQRFIVTQHEASRAWGRDEDRSEFKTHCRSLISAPSARWTKNCCDKNRVWWQFRCGGQMVYQAVSNWSNHLPVSSTPWQRPPGGWGGGPVLIYLAGYTQVLFC